MAINLGATYPGRIFVDGENPRGTFKDSDPAGSFNGTPAQYAWARDMWAFLEKLLDVGGITASGTPDTAANSERYDALLLAARDVWPLWDSTHTYLKGIFTLGSDNKIYQSLQAANINKNPVSSPTWWIPRFEDEIIWKSTETYLKGALVLGSDDLIYQSLQAANINKNPVSSPTWWIKRFVNATTILKGLVELATTAENVAGTSDLVVPTSKGIREAFNASGSAPVFACRAWVNFNGTAGTPTPLGSGNVTSITDQGTGRYLINFITNIEDTDYTVFVTGTRNSLATNVGALGQMGLDSEKLIGSTGVQIKALNGVFFNITQVNVAIFR